MKPLANALIFALVLLVSSRVSLAEWLIEDVSAERAKELGVTLRAQPNGTAGIKITMDFKPEGTLKDFSHVELRVQSEEKSLLTAPLQIARPAPDRATVYFSADPTQLKGSSLTIFVPGGLGGEAYRFHVPKYVEVEKVR